MKIEKNNENLQFLQKFLFITYVSAKKILYTKKCLEVFSIIHLNH